MLGFPQLIQPRKTLDKQTVAKIDKELCDREGFNSYKEIQLWLLVCQDVKISYSTIHKIVRYKLRGKLKVPRPTHEKQKPGVIEQFKICFPNIIQGLKKEILEKWSHNQKISFWFQDETRLGYLTG